MKFPWIAAEKAGYPLVALCGDLDVAPSGFYAWQARPESQHTGDDRRLKVLVHTWFAESRGNDGSRRVRDDLIEHREHVSRKRVVWLIQEEKLVARVPKRYKHTTIA